MRFLHNRRLAADWNSGRSTPAQRREDRARGTARRRGSAWLALAHEHRAGRACSLSGTHSRTTPLMLFWCGGSSTLLHRMCYALYWSCPGITIPSGAGVGVRSRGAGVKRSHLDRELRTSEPRCNRRRGYFQPCPLRGEVLEQRSTLRIPVRDGGHADPPRQCATDHCARSRIRGQGRRPSDRGQRGGADRERLTSDSGDWHSTRVLPSPSPPR
jgi:hypothetical protein